MEVQCEDARDLRRGQLLHIGQELLQHRGIDVAVVLVPEVSPITIPESRAQKRNHPILNSAFDSNRHLLVSFFGMLCSEHFFRQDLQD